MRHASLAIVIAILLAGCSDQLTVGPDRNCPPATQRSTGSTSDGGRQIDAGPPRQVQIRVHSPDGQPFPAEIDRKLVATTMPELRLDRPGLTFEQAVTFLRDLSRVDISVNWAAVQGTGITKDTEVSLRCGQVTLQQAIERLLVAAAGREGVLDYSTARGQLRISTVEDLGASKYVMIYDVRGQIEVHGRQGMMFFLDLIRTAVLPTSWAPQGDANILEMQGLLIVKQSGAGHRELFSFLTQLATALSVDAPPPPPEKVIDPSWLGKGVEADTIKKHGFVITPETRNCIEEFYTEDGLNGLPPLVTTDLMLHAYNLLYSNSLKDFEKAQVKNLDEWQADLWNRLGELDPTQVDAAALKHARGLVAVGRKLLDPKWRPPAGANLPDWVDAEVAAAIAADKSLPSQAWSRTVHYTMFKPRGFYANDEKLARFFQARIWWSRYPFRLGNPVELRLAILLARPATADPRQYVSLNGPYARLLGKAEDPDLADLRGEAFDGDGKQIAPDEVVKSLRQRFRPRIRIGDTEDELLQPGTCYGVYALTPKYLFDSEVFTLTTSDETEPQLGSHRDLSMCVLGLDYMTALGCDLARKLDLDRADGELCKPLASQLDLARKRRAADQSSSRISLAVMKVYDTLHTPAVTELHPPFMRSEPYARKSLQTALAGWAETRHRWQLYAKEASGGVFGDVDEDMPDVLSPVGFVEPNAEFWDRLIVLTRLTAEEMRDVTGKRDSRWKDLLNILTECQKITSLELTGQPIPRSMGELFEGLAESLGEMLGDTDQPDRCDPVIAFIHRGQDGCSVSVGTGYPQAMMAVFPHQGKQWLCRGAVMTYREVADQAGGIMNDDEWRQSDGVASPPDWAADFCPEAEIEQGPDDE